LSAPVLSWLFTAQGKPRVIPYPTTIAMHNPLSTKRHQVASALPCLTLSGPWVPRPCLKPSPFSQRKVN